MKDYKRLLAGLVLLLLIIITGVSSWLWFNNSKNIDPLPILSSEDSQLATQNSESVEDNDTLKNNKELNTLYLQAQESLQVPLDDVIVSFEARYPHIQVLTNYVPATSLFTLDNTNATDMVIANNQLSDSLLALLQDELNRNIENNIVNPPTSSNNNAIDGAARILNPFNYAIKNSKSMEGVILSDKPIAISFRNFLVSSAGQDILKKYELDSIDDYQNSVDDLFNPSSNGKTAVEQTKVVTDALTNGE